MVVFCGQPDSTGILRWTVQRVLIQNRSVSLLGIVISLQADEPKTCFIL
jgi:hypothetical protein